ncbi:MAG: hybrid sensor histidine kinase/response regulator [Planctomycetota bacterium]
MNRSELRLVDFDVRPLAQRRRRHLRVLALEDDPLDVEQLRQCFMSIDDWSFELVPCRTLSEARGVVEGMPLDLVFVDERLPEMSGLEALRELRAAGLEAPAILLADTPAGAVVPNVSDADVAGRLSGSQLDADGLRRVAGDAIARADVARAVAERTGDLESLVGRLRERCAETESFHHHVAHELRTPLSGAREFIALVLDGAAGALTREQSRLLSIALRNCDRMAACVYDLVDVARLETGALRLERRSVDVLFLAQDACESLRRRALDASVELEIVAPTRTLELELDPQRIFQVLTNVIANAIEHSRRGERITVELERTVERGVAITVTDRGRGISPADLGRVFDRLFRSERPNGVDGGGLGLGLHVSKHIVELHGGTIELDSEHGRGTRVRFTLPVPTGAPAACPTPSP